MKYCPYPFKTHRFKTREVSVGKILIGGNQPIRIQSMTTTDTQDSQKTAEQNMQLADAGCEMVRVTVQGVKEALSCEKIKSI
jgi:(E)-4-hydroxy-3-methylbut-2-enyl-diphosphate synthase